MQKTNTNCPVCLSNLKEAKPNIILVCSGCNNSLFAYEDKHKQIKVMPFHLGIQLKTPNQGWQETEDDFEEDSASEETPFTKHL